MVQFLFAGLIRITRPGPLQSSMSWPSTSRLAFSIASASSAHVSGSNPTKCPSTPTVYARYSAIRVYSKGRSSPVRSLATSGDRNGSSPSQPRHWSLRPPVFQSVFQSRNRMGLRQFGQIGGGVFLRMTLTLDQARAQNSLSPIKCRGPGGDEQSVKEDCTIVCPVPDPVGHMSNRVSNIASLKAGTRNAAKLNNAGGVGIDPDIAIPRQLSVCGGRKVGSRADSTNDRI